MTAQRWTEEQLAEYRDAVQRGKDLDALKRSTLWPIIEGWQATREQAVFDVDPSDAEALQSAAYAARALREILGLLDQVEQEAEAAKTELEEQER